MSTHRMDGPQQPLPDPSARNLGLDVARATAILMVFSSHALTAALPMPAMLGTALAYMAHAGVELFFSLSGFLIGGILLRLARTGTTPGTVLHFMLRRWLRTLPAYVVVLAILGAWLDMDIRHSLLLLQTFYPAEPRAMPVSWSLVMEEYFYVAFPLLMLALAAFARRSIHLVAAVAVLLILACTAARFAVAYGVLHVGWPEVHESPLLRMDCAAYGAIAAWAVAAFPRLHLTPRAARRLIVLGAAGTLLAAAIFVTIVHVPNDTLVGSGFALWGPVYMAEQYAGLDTLYALAILGLARAAFAPPSWLARAIRATSLLSYSIYLVHLGVIAAILQSVPAGPATLPLAIAATLLAAWLSYTLVERPFLALRERIAPGQREAATPLMAALRP